MNQPQSGLIFAGNSVSEGLFKFRRYDNDKDAQRVKSILDGNLYFSNCEQLNDPFEMRVRLRTESNDTRRRAGVHKAMKDSHMIEKMAPAKRLVRAGQISNRLSTDRAAIRRVEKKHYDRMQTNCFVFCTSATRLHPLLWSHYADSHKGVCVQFDHGVEPLVIAAKVNYTTEYPAATYPFQHLIELTEKGILTKAKYWEYEEEYRLFSVRMDNPAWHLGLSWEDEHTAVVDPKCIVGITLGARMPESQRQELAAYCRKNYPALYIDQAEISEEQFAINIRPYIAESA